VIVGWILGVIIAKGFWSTLFSIFFAPWAWYLTLEYYFFLPVGV